MTDRSFKKLEEISKGYHTDLEPHVASIIINGTIDLNEGSTDEALKTWYKGLETGGCESGFVNELIYTRDTHRFFDTHYEDIMDLVKEYGLDLNQFNDLKNNVAWVAFELTAFNLQQIIELGE